MLPNVTETNKPQANVAHAYECIPRPSAGQTKSPTGQQATERDKEFLKLPGEVQSLVAEYNGLKRLRSTGTLTEGQQARYRELTGWNHSFSRTWESMRKDSAEGREVSRDRAVLKREAKDYYKR